MARLNQSISAKQCMVFKEKNAFQAENAILISDLEKGALAYLPYKSYTIVGKERIYLNPLKVKRLILIEFFICVGIALIPESFMIYKTFFNSNITFPKDWIYYAIPIFGIVIIQLYLYIAIYQPFKKLFFTGIYVDERGHCEYREKSECQPNEYELSPLFKYKKNKA